MEGCKPANSLGPEGSRPYRYFNCCFSRERDVPPQTAMRPVKAIKKTRPTLWLSGRVFECNSTPGWWRDPARKYFVEMTLHRNIAAITSAADPFLADSGYSDQKI